MTSLKDRYCNMHATVSTQTEEDAILTSICQNSGATKDQLTTAISTFKSNFYTTQTKHVSGKTTLTASMASIVAHAPKNSNELKLADIDCLEWATTNAGFGQIFNPNSNQYFPTGSAACLYGLCLDVLVGGDPDPCS